MFHPFDSASKYLKTVFFPLSHLANCQPATMSLIARWQTAKVKIYSIFERFLEILLEISRCHNHSLPLWIWMRDPFRVGSLLSSLTSPSYPLKPIKRSSISLGRGSPLEHQRRLYTIEAVASLQVLSKSHSEPYIIVGKILSLHILETL